ncbi:MAG: hypothetical protein IJV00_09340 [Clostridia bacterium]|nr:hypothetical protein [Clostridia bacterium]
MAENKERKIISVDSGKETTVSKPAVKTAAAKPASERKTVAAAPTGSSAGFRAGAIALWILALVFEVLALLVFLDKINLKFIPQLWQIIVFLVLDLACVIIGSQLWKKANHIKPASKKNAFLFWLWNNMGLVVCAFAFIPFIIVVLTNKNADPKTKTIATIAAVIALLIGGVASYDWNPISAEEKNDAVAVVTGDVYWTQFGKKYHTHDDCGALANSETLYKGDVSTAIANNKTDLCKFCAKKDDITGIRIEEGEVAEEVEKAEEAAKTDEAAVTQEAA